MTRNKRIGLLGYGVIGGAIGRAAAADGFADVAFVHGRDQGGARKAFPGAAFVADARAVADQDVDLVVEAATADVVRAVAPGVLARRDMLIFTMTGLADDGFRQAISRDVPRFGHTALLRPRRPHRPRWHLRWALGHRRGQNHHHQGAQEPGPRGPDDRRRHLRRSRPERRARTSPATSTSTPAWRSAASASTAPTASSSPTRPPPG